MDSLLALRPFLPEDFHRFFFEHYEERWPALFRSLLEPERKVLRKCFSDDTDNAEPLWLKGCAWSEASLDSKSGDRSGEGLLYNYIMDPASVVVAQALGVESGQNVLDMCAAPGGKTLVLLENLVPEGHLVANEVSRSRRDRLVKVIRQYVPAELRARVIVTGKDGLRFGVIEADHYDRVLIDAPCSGERHLIDNKKESQGWTRKRSQRLAQKQYGLLCSGLLSLRPGGRLVYSTCSLSPFENDEVIAKLLKKKKGLIEPEELKPPPLAEKTQYGYQYLPDRCGFGPMYFASLHKVPVRIW